MGKTAENDGLENEYSRLGLFGQVWQLCGGVPTNVAAALAMPLSAAMLSLEMLALQGASGRIAIERADK